MTDKQDTNNPHADFHRRLREMPPDLACCYRCEWRLWAVGAGQGVRCTHPDNAGKSFGEGQPAMKLPLVPGLWEKCQHFEKRSPSEPTSEEKR